MNQDWKDALSSLRNSMPSNEDGNLDETFKEEESDAQVQKEKLTIVTDKKGRNGKTATIIEGFTIPQNKVEDIAKSLKQKLGVGGSVREGEILIQGEHKEKIKKFLLQNGFKTN